MKRTAAQASVALLLLCLAASAHAHFDTRGIGWEQHPGMRLPLELRFRDENNRIAALQSYFDGAPVILVLTYFSCPELCPIVLHSLQQSLQSTGLEAGRDYRLVAVSIDPRDTPSRAVQEKVGILRPSPLQRTAHFLTAPDVSASVLARKVGFRYAYDARHGQFAHAAGFVVVDPRGRISRYFLGVSYPPAQLRSAVIEAGRGQIAAVADQLLLLCYHFDPTLGPYSAAVVSLLRILGVAAVLACALAWWRLVHSP